MNAKQPQPPPDNLPTSRPVIPPPPPPKIRNPGRESLDHAVARLAAQVAGLKERQADMVRKHKQQVDRMHGLLETAIDNLDPEMHGREIRWLRDLLIKGLREVSDE